jgi:low affinity Fe/Cu permease
MVFLIQNSQNRDAAAMGPHQSTTLMGTLQAKFDELIRALEGARNEFIGIGHMTDRQVEAIRTALEADVAAHPRGHGRAASVERLLERR